MNYETEQECCPFCDAYGYFEELRKNNLSEEDSFRMGLELFAEKFIANEYEEIFEDGLKEGYAMAFEEVAENMDTLAMKVRSMVDPCEDCDCQDGECIRD